VAAREHELPWLAARLKRARVLVNVAGATVADYVEVIAGLADQPVIAAFEINASCQHERGGPRVRGYPRRAAGAGAPLPGGRNQAYVGQAVARAARYRRDGARRAG